MISFQHFNTNCSCHSIMQRFTPFHFISFQFQFLILKFVFHFMALDKTKKIKRKNVEIFRVRSSITISNTYHQTRSQSTITPNQNIFQRQVKCYLNFDFFSLFVKKYRIFDQHGNFDPFFIVAYIIFYLSYFNFPCHCFWMCFVMQVSLDEMELNMIRD